MKTALQELIDGILTAGGIADLRAHLVPGAISYFGAARGALFLTAEVPDELRFRQNPVIRALLEGHAPLHEEQIVEAREWKALCSRADHGHVLVGPLVRKGELVGALAFTRGQETSAFDAQNVADLSALCLHASIQMAGWESRSETDYGLSPREGEIVSLVARGKTNAQIGRELFVSSETVKAALKTIFRKVGVSSRAQLVARLGLQETPL